MKLIDTSIFTDFSTQFNMTQLDEHDKKWLFRRNNWRICLSFIKNYKKRCFAFLIITVCLFTLFFNIKKQKHPHVLST